MLHGIVRAHHHDTVNCLSPLRRNRPDLDGDGSGGGIAPPRVRASYNPCARLPRGSGAPGRCLPRACGPRWSARPEPSTGSVGHVCSRGIFCILVVPSALPCLPMGVLLVYDVQVSASPDDDGAFLVRQRANRCLDLHAWPPCPLCVRAAPRGAVVLPYRALNFCTCPSVSSTMLLPV